MSKAKNTAPKAEASKTEDTNTDAAADAAPASFDDLPEEHQEAFKEMVREVVGAMIDEAVETAVNEALAAGDSGAPQTSGPAPKTGKFDVKNTGKSPSGYFDADGIEMSLNPGQTDKGVKLALDSVETLERTGFKVTKAK